MTISNRNINKRFLLDLVENASDLIQSVDMEGRFIYVNRTWRETLGYSAEEIDSLTLWDIIHPDSTDHCRGYFGEVCVSGKVCNVEAAFQSKDGRMIKVSGNVNCRYIRGKPVSTRGIFRNVTEINEMENRLRLRSELLDYAGDAITLRDKTGKLLYCNRAAYQRLGYTEDEYFKLYIKDITDPENAMHIDQRIKEIFRKGELSLKSIRVAKDGTLVPVEINARTIGVGSEKVVLSVERDITDRKMVEDELRLKNHQLEEATLAKSKFLASMSHELRTPLNAIIGFSELILDGTVCKVNRELEDVVKEIFTGGHRLLNLINDIMDMSKVEAGKMDLTIVALDLSESVDSAAQGLKPLIQKKQLNLLVSLPSDLPMVRADAARLEQVLVNLLSNAIKFTNGGGNIKIEAAVENGFCRVSISDNGIGIRKRDMGKLFEAYTQAKTMPTRKPEGTGLGLKISKQLVELMGGTIWAESTFRKGSKFHFTLPVSK